MNGYSLNEKEAIGMNEVWRFIDSGKCSPSYNMALDEALLNWHSEGVFPQLFAFMDGILLRYQSATFNGSKKRLIWRPFAIKDLDL